MKAPIRNSPGRGKRKLALWAFWLLVAYTVIGFLILPPIVRRVAVSQISKQIDREVSIQSVKINPYVLSTTIRGFLIKDKDGEPFVSWDEVYVNFQLVSFFGRAWVFKEIRTSRPFVRAQMNKDGTFNFTDIVNKFTATSTPAKPEAPSRPLVLHIERLQIAGATAAVADFTPRTPFKRLIGPLDITLEDFQTDPDNKNPYAFAGTTDAGERISWRGHFYLSPLRSEGELKLFDFTLNKYAPLYQDLVRFEIRGGSVAMDLKYRFELDATNRVAQITDSAFGLEGFKLGEPGDSNNVIELPVATVAGASVDLQKRQASIDAITADGARIVLKRNKDAAINVLELAKPAATAENAPGGVLFLLRAVTNAVAMLLESTNQWTGSLGRIDVTNCAAHLEDHVNSRPATLDLSDIALNAHNISNLPGTNLDAEVSLRWNTNGSVKVTSTASFLPPTADVQVDVDQLDLSTLDPCLEPMVNLFILGSRIGLHGTVRLRTAADQLPQVTFQGNASLDDFHTVDGAFGEDLVKWQGVHVTGIDARLRPPAVAIQQIAVDNAYARVVIETNDSINLFNALRMSSTNLTARKSAKAGPASIPNTATNPPLPQVSIGAIVITNTVLSFTDRSIKPEVDLSVRDIDGTLAGLSTEPQGRADIRLAAKVDGVGPALISGAVSPFDQTRTNVVKVDVKDVDLTPTSPYSGKFAGYRIAEGKLNLNLAYEIVGQRLNSKNLITLDQFNFGESVNSPEATHLPVRLGVALLKDRSGKIVLDVPVEGRLDDPQFRIGKVVLRVIVNILEKAATSPFSLLGAVFGGGGEELGQQEFAPGSTELSAVDKQRLDTVQKALFARPALRLGIVGSIDPDGDREGLQRAALDWEIRSRLWQRLKPAERGTNSVENLPVSPDLRAEWVKRLYEEGLSNGRLSPEFLAAHTNLAAAAEQAAPQPARTEKGAALLVQAAPPPKPAASTGPVYHSKLLPPPDPMEALLLATLNVKPENLEALAGARAQRVQAYLVEHSKVDPGRLFLKSGTGATVRKDGSRAYLELQ